MPVRLISALPAGGTSTCNEPGFGRASSRSDFRGGFLGAIDYIVRAGHDVTGRGANNRYNMGYPMFPKPGEFFNLSRNFDVLQTRFAPPSSHLRWEPIHQLDPNSSLRFVFFRHNFFFGTNFSLPSYSAVVIPTRPLDKHRVRWYYSTKQF